MVWQPHNRAMPNYVITKTGDGSSGKSFYTDSLLNASGCSSCDAVSSADLDTRERWNGVFQMKTIDGNPGEVDYFGCPTWKKEPYIIAGKRGTECTIAPSGSTWRLTVNCQRVSDGEPFGIWTGLQRESTKGADTGPAGTYVRDGGCASTPLWLMVEKRDHYPCPCPPIPSPCPAGMTVQINKFSIADWVVANSGCGGSACVSTASLNSSPGTGNWSVWTGAVPHYGGVNRCWWQVKTASHVYVPCDSVGSGLWGRFTCDVRLIGSWWLFQSHPFTGTYGSAGYGFWAKDVGDTPSGVYRTINQPDWEYVAGSGFADCTNNFCEHIGPDPFEIQ